MIASWKLFWLSILPFVLLFAFFAATTDLANDAPAEPNAVEGALTIVAILASLVLWGAACVQLARERYIATFSRVLTILFSFFFPIVFILIFLIAPNRHRESRSR